MCRLLRLGKTADSSPGRGRLAGPGFGCIRGSIAPHRTGNHGEVMSARQAPLSSGLRAHGRLRPVCRAPLSGRRRGYSGRGRAAGDADAGDCAATGPRRPAAVPGAWFAADLAQDDHPVERLASAAGCRGRMGEPAARPRTNGISLVSRSVSCSDGTGLSLGDRSTRSGIFPMFEPCLSPDNASPGIAGWGLRPEEVLAVCGSR
jgi:hypothetical protein